MAPPKTEESPTEELIEAVHLLETVHTDHTNLKDNFQQLKDFYEELVDAHQALKARYAELQDERDAVEAQYQQLCNGWRVELEDKQAAFEKARTQILSQRDIELLKARLSEQIETPYISKCETLRKEAERAQVSLAALRREHGAMKAQTEARVWHLETQLQNARSGSGAQLEALRQRATAAEDKAEVLDAASKAARQAMQERENHLADIRHLRTEVDDLAADKAAAEKRCAQAVHAAEARAAVAQAAQLEAQHLLEGAHARRRALEGEVSQLDVSGRRLAEQVHACRREVSQQAARAEAERAAHADEARAWDAAAREAAARAEEQRAEVAAEARASERRLEAQIAAAQADLEQLRREVASKVAEAEAPLHARVQELQAESQARDGERARLNVQAQERADAAAQRAALLESEVARLCEELKGAREEVCRARGEAGDVRAAAADLHAQLEGNKAHLEQTEARCADAQARLQQREAQLASAVQEAKDAHVALTLADERAAQLRSAHEAAQRGHEGALQELRSAMEAAGAMRMKEAKLHAEATVANLQRDVQVSDRRCQILQREVEGYRRDLERMAAQLRRMQAPPDGRLQLRAVSGCAAQATAKQGVKGGGSTLEELQQQMEALRKRQEPYLRERVSAR